MASSRFQASICLLVVVALAIGVAVEGKQLKRLEFYLHEQFVSVPGYPTTDVLIAAPSGNTSLFAFGNFGVSEHVIREGISNTSIIIGRAPGTFQPGTQDKTFALYKQLSLQTEKWNGTIVVFSYSVDSSANEWTVVGGTGMFRMVRGYAINELVAGGPDSISLTFKWEVYLLYP